MERLKSLLSRSNPDATAARLRRRKALVSVIPDKLPFAKFGLFFLGYAWMILVPSPRLGRGTYIDENALQPGQVNTYWGWSDVHRADQYLAQLEHLRVTNATSEERAKALSSEFQASGLRSATQSFVFNATTGVMSGANAYAVLSSPRTSGTEAMVISASWLSRDRESDGAKLNLRGVSTVLALANFSKKYSLWAKDLVFIISDGYLEGMHAFLSSYHGSSQPNLEAGPLTISSGVIWTALNIDYPGHSFSHLGVFFEGLNGRLPNQDLLNSIPNISRYTAGVPVTLYDHLGPEGSPAKDKGLFADWLPRAINEEVDAYVFRAKNIFRHIGFQARGRPSGVHGVFHQFRIDAITIFAMPAIGPHGFHAIGRVIESTLRTTNNLLERLHASFFFYIMADPDKFLKIGYFLPSAVLVSVAMMFGGLKLWSDAAWTRDAIEKDKGSKGSEAAPWRRRRRPVLVTLSIMIFTHILGIALFFAVNKPWCIENHKVVFPLLFIIVAAVPLVFLLVPATSTAESAPVSLVLNALNLCFASTIVSVTTVLNFSLAATMAVLLGLPLTFASAPPRRGLAARLTKYSMYVFLGFGWLVCAHGEAREALWMWEILRGWFAPFVCVVYGPLALQAGIVSLLP